MSFNKGTNVSVITDCSALRWLDSFKDTKSRLFRWSMRLSAYTFTVTHRSGRSNVVADALSRHPPETTAVTIASVTIDQIRDAQDELPPTIRPTTMIDGTQRVHLHGSLRLHLPESLIPQVLQDCHDKRNHPGINITHQIVAQRYWWPSRTQDITDYVRSCETCQAVKHSNQASLRQLQPFEVPETPNSLWSIDTVVLGSAAKYAQCIVDHHSRFCWTFPTRTNTTEIVLSSLTTLFSCVGKPRVLISDNGTNFVSKKMTSFLRSHSIEHRRTSAYHPQANGLNERTHYSIIRGISLAMRASHSRLKWSTLAKKATADYNETPHGVTGFPPVFLQFGTRPEHCPFEDISLEEARKIAVQRIQQQQHLRKIRHDKNHCPSNFKEGDQVWHRVPHTHPDKHKLSAVYDGPYTIKTQNGPESFLITRATGETRAEVRTHASSLKPYFSRPARLKPP